jgi:hypothetical protein
MRLYHGTDLPSAERLLAGSALDATAAAPLKIDGLPGFFLATELSDAEFFALRRSRRIAVVLAFDLSDLAAERLVDAGAAWRPTPVSQQSPSFAGDELFVPPATFALFNQLAKAGEITVSPG